MDVGAEGGKAVLHQIRVRLIGSAVVEYLEGGRFPVRADLAVYPERGAGTTRELPLNGILAHPWEERDIEIHTRRVQRGGRGLANRGEDPIVMQPEGRAAGKEFGLRSRRVEAEHIRREYLVASQV